MRQKRRRHRQTEKEVMCNGSRYCSDVFTTLGTPRISNNHHKLEGRHEIVSLSESPERTNTADSLISDLGLPKQ